VADDAGRLQRRNLRLVDLANDVAVGGLTLRDQTERVRLLVLVHEIRDDAFICHVRLTPPIEGMAASLIPALFDVSAA
jgi:hypothetical protein